MLSKLLYLASHSSYVMIIGAEIGNIQVYLQLLLASTVVIQFVVRALYYYLW
jgi:hypothetical protein